MKLLVIADEESKYLWDHYDPAIFEDVDFIISAGDLKAKYLSFLTTITRKRVFYVHGNHDNRYEKDPPLGCDCLEDMIVVQNGIRMLGLGGSYRYKQGPFQYSEKQMRKRAKRLRTMIKMFGGIDIIVTHAPAKGLGDGDDLPHKGFQTFVDMINEYQPSYFIHGHQHLNYGHNSVRIRELNKTTLVNGYNYHFLDYEKNDVPHFKYNPVSRFFNTLIFYIRYHDLKVTKEYRKYKRYLKNINM